MILKQIKATTKIDQVNLLIGDLFLPFPVDLLSVYKLAKGREIDDDLLAKLVLESVSFQLVNYSLRLIAMSPQTQATVQSKLRVYLSRYLLKKQLKLTRESQIQIIDQAVTKLADRGLLDEYQFALFLLNRFKNKSRQEIIYRLKRAGVDPLSLPSDLFADQDDTLVIKSLIHKKLKNPDDLTDFATRNRLTAYLIRKGFALNSVKNAIDTLLANR